MRTLILVAALMAIAGASVADNLTCLPARQPKTAQQISAELARNKQWVKDNWELFQLSETIGAAGERAADIFQSDALLYYDSGNLRKALEHQEIALRLKTKFRNPNAPPKAEWGPRRPQCPPGRAKSSECSGWLEEHIRTYADIEVAEMLALISIFSEGLGDHTQAVVTSKLADLVFENWVIQNATSPRRVSQALAAQGWIDALRLRALAKIATSGGPLGKEALERGLSVLQRAQFGKVDWSIRQAAARRATSDPRVAELIQQWQTLQEARSEVGNDQTRLEEIAKKIRMLESQLPASGSAIAAELFFKPVKIDEIKKSLKPDEAMLIVLPTDVGTHTIWFTVGNAGWEISQVKCQSISERVGALLAPLSAPNKGSFDRRQSFELYSALWAPAMRAIGNRVIYLSVTGDLARVPPGVLVTAPPSGSNSDASALRRTKWLLNSNTVVAVPSVRAAIAAQSNGRSVNERVVVVGDPVLPETGTTQTTYRSGPLGRLPYTEEEIEAVVQGVPANKVTKLTRNLATKSELVRTDLTRVRLLLFSTHATMASGSDDRKEPALVMTGEAGTGDLLKASEIASLPIDADSIVLSGCNTASADKLDGTAFSGLASSFLFAGGRSVVVTHWPVFDKASATIVGNAFAAGGPRTPRDVAIAIRREALKLMNNSTEPRMAEPVSWAPYTVVGR